MPRIIKKESLKPLTIDQFDRRKNNILIYRQYGGLGDILMLRMIFEDIKKINPNNKLYFACPSFLKDAVIDYPYLDGILDAETVNKEDFYTYDVSHACTRYEIYKGSNADKHRSDIWAESCGVELTNHEMHISLTNNEIEFGLNEIEKYSKESKPNVIFCPISAMNSKNLQVNHIKDIVDELKDFNLIGLHKCEIKELTQFGIPTICNLNIRQWMGVINACDYVLCVDTSTFHFAGGINKPTLGVFTWADGQVYGKYYKKAEIFQIRKRGENFACPCYRFSSCPLSKEALKPCLTEIKGIEIAQAFKKMTQNNK